MADFVRKLTDRNLNFLCDEFAQIVDKPELHEVPIAIYSVSGPTKSGKSYLLNVFYHLMRDHPVHDENRQQEFMQVFTSTRQVESETDGIYMTTKPLYKSSGSKQVAVFLMDTQGIEAGDRIECKDAYLFAISLTLGFMQIINVKQDFRWKHLDTYAALTLYTKHLEIGRNRRKRLMVVVRDWENPHQYSYGYEGGNRYVTAVRNKPNLGRQVLCMDDRYSTFECFLVSHPGKKVATTNTKRVKDLDEDTWQEMRTLHQLLFSQEYISRANEEAPKGREILQLARELQTQLRVSQLHPPEASFEIFFDIEMNKKVENCFVHYKTAIEPFKERTGNAFQLRHEIAEEDAKAKMMRHVIGDINKHLELLQEKITAEFEIITGRHTIVEFVKSWNINIKKKGNFRNSEVREFFLDEGKRFKETLTRQLQNENSRKVVFDDLQQLLARSYMEERKRRNRNKLIAACIGATAVGAAGGASLAAIPAFVAFAVAAELSTAGVIALGAGGMGAGGGFFGGLIGGTATDYNQSKQDDEPPDLNVEEDGNQHMSDDDGTNHGAAVNDTGENVNANFEPVDRNDEMAQLIDNLDQIPMRDIRLFFH